MAVKNNKDRFEFDLEYQWDIIRFTLTDRDGHKALSLYKHDYFELNDQQIIIKAVERYFKRRKRIPLQSSILNEELRQVFRTKDHATSLKEEDRARIKRKVKNLYKRPVKGGEDIIDKCRLFASYIQFKKELENIDLNNFDGYDQYAKKIQKAINIGNEVTIKQGSFMVSGVNHRISERKFKESSFPTPFKQLNKLSNSDGYNKGTVIVIMDKPKMGKTFTLINVARGYLRLRKKVIIFDLENGEDQYTTRIDQSIAKETKRNINSGYSDLKLKKIYRKYSRLGAELFIKRMPNGSTTQDFQNVLDEHYNEFGIRYEVAIVDYIALMGSLSGVRDDLQRISDCYLDVKNFADHNQLESVWTGHHVKRESYKRRATKYESGDVAKCTDIERHIDILLGIQQNHDEERDRVYRIEIIVQRDGIPDGCCLFWADRDNQRLEEFTINQREEYFNQLHEAQESDDDFKNDLDE